MKRPWLTGMLVGQAIWASSYAAALRNWGGVFNIIAAPVTILGWVLIWGDGPGRIEFVETTFFTVVFGLCAYGWLGAAVANFISRKRQRRL
jgi:hypothetical protein